MDITGVDPDIRYRVEITEGNAPFNTYFVNFPEFNFILDNRTSTSVIYEFRVTPINGAGNGTTSAPVTGYFRGGELSVRRIGMESYPWSALPIHLLATFALSQYITTEHEI